MNQEQLVDLLKNIQHYIISWFKNTPPVPTPQQSDVEWLLAIEGKQYGPYSVEMIKEMISSGQVKQEVTYGWKLGMDQWLFLSDIDEFKQQSAPPTPPPLPDMATIGQKPASNPIPIQKVELNTASIEDLLALPGIDLSMAKRFTDERTKRNGFSSFTEVRELLNLQPHLFEEIRKSTLLKPIASNISGNGRMIDF
nr:helix-hairpin-helix domain-containing protein [Bacillus sp. B15-48]